MTNSTALVTITKNNKTVIVRPSEFNDPTTLNAKLETFAKSVKAHTVNLQNAVWGIHTGMFSAAAKTPKNVVISGGPFGATFGQVSN